VKSELPPTDPHLIIVPATIVEGAVYVTMFASPASVSIALKLFVTPFHPKSVK
jgi:hypothetical protein